jgi:hypothetical protein
MKNECDAVASIFVPKPTSHPQPYPLVIPTPYPIDLATSSSVHRAPAARLPPALPLRTSPHAGNLTPPLPTFRPAGQGAARPVISCTKHTGCRCRNGPEHFLLGCRRNRPKHLLLGHGPSAKGWSAGRQGAPLTGYARATRLPG